MAVTSIERDDIKPLRKRDLLAFRKQTGAEALARLAVAADKSSGLMADAVRDLIEKTLDQNPGFAMAVLSLFPDEVAEVMKDLGYRWVIDGDAVIAGWMPGGGVLVGTEHDFIELGRIILRGGAQRAMERPGLTEAGRYMAAQILQQSKPKLQVV